MSCLIQLTMNRFGSSSMMPLFLSIHGHIEAMYERL